MRVRLILYHSQTNFLTRSMSYLCTLTAAVYTISTLYTGDRKIVRKAYPVFNHYLRGMKILIIQIKWNGGICATNRVDFEVRAQSKLD